MHLAHTALFASDLERTRDFFTAYFDCAAGPLYHNHSTGFRSYFLTFSGGGQLELMDMPGIAPADGLRRRGLDVPPVYTMDQAVAVLSKYREAGKC